MITVLLGCMVAVSSGCVGPIKDTRGTVSAKESFSIGAFKPSTAGYNCGHYDAAKMTEFLTSINGRFEDGDVVAVDGLKWRKKGTEWTPVPNPPIPVMKVGDTSHTRKYAEWINDHPHFGYPPLPLDDKR